MLISFEGYVEGYKNPPEVTYPREIQDNETIDNLVAYLKEDFNIDIKDINVNSLSQERCLKIQFELTKYYKTLSEINNKHLESQIFEVKNVLKTYLGYSDKKVDKIFNPEKSKIDWKKFCWLSYYLSFALFVMTTLIFLAGFATFMTMYIFKII